MMINIHLALSNLVRIMAFEVGHCSNPYGTITFNLYARQALND